MPKYIENPSEIQIREWGDKGHVMEVGGKKLYFTPLKDSLKLRSIFSRALMFQQRGNILEAGEVVMKELRLGGNPVFLNDNSMEYISAAIKFYNIWNGEDFLEVKSYPIIGKKSKENSQK